MPPMRRIDFVQEPRPGILRNYSPRNESLVKNFGLREIVEDLGRMRVCRGAGTRLFFKFIAAEICVMLLDEISSLEAIVETPGDPVSAASSLAVFPPRAVFE